MSASVSSLTNVNHIGIGLFLSMYKGWSNETWYKLMSGHDHLNACTISDLDLLVMVYCLRKNGGLTCINHLHLGLFLTVSKSKNNET